MVELFGELTPVVLLAMLPGVIEMLKKWSKLVDTPAEILAFGVGFVLFFLYQLQTVLGVVYAQWFSIVFYSILAPLTVMGYYNLTKGSAKG
jgi:hypothetical protein